MGTSNWQNIPFNIDALMKIEPRRVLDIGVGFGRWGVLVHEFCDVWFQRVQSKDWEVKVEGIEAFAPNIEHFQKNFYDEIHIGDASEVVDRLEGRFDLVIFGDVLEHFTKDAATTILNKCLEFSDYVMVNIPLGDDWPQEEMYGNKYEAHLSEWNAEDFRSFDLVREQHFVDFANRLFGCFVLSRRDPKDLRGALFSKDTGPGQFTGGVVGVSAGVARPGPDGPALNQVEKKVKEMAFELEFLKTCRPVRRLLKRPNRVVRSLGRWRKSGVQVKALAEANASSKGVQVAILGARSEVVQEGLPWYFMDGEDAWILRDHPSGQYGKALVADEVSELKFILRGHAPLLRFESGPNAGKVEVTRRGHSLVLDLYAEEPGIVELDPKTREVVSGRGATEGGAPPPRSVEIDAALARLQAAGETTLAVRVDGWLGVGAATETLFSHVVGLEQNLSDAWIEAFSQQFLEAGVRHLVLSGVTPSHLRLARRIREKEPACRVDTVWHGNFLQAREDYAWKVFRLMVDAARDGVIHKVGCVKKGMESWLSSMEVRSALLLNYVPDLPDGPSTPDGGGVHVGMWISNEGYRKLPYAMLAAVRMVPGVVLRGAGLSRRALEFVEFQGMDTGRLQEDPLPRDELFGQIAGSHLSLYVTSSECCPMLPLESLAKGVPCLLGPNSHLFEDDATLRDFLVVDYHERADVIARDMQRVLEARSEVVEAYRRWAPGYEERARQSVRDFLAD